jgi:hypothetical protein
MDEKDESHGTWISITLHYPEKVWREIVVAIKERIGAIHDQARGGGEASESHGTLTKLMWRCAKAIEDRIRGK